MIKPSTFSIVAYDPETKSFGVAVASKFLAVGAVVPYLSSTAGAIATQSYANLAFGIQGLPFLAQHLSAEDAFEQIAKNDPRLQTRQVGIVDLSGHSFTFTGNECHDWAGGITGPGYAIQGNLLVGEQVVKSMENAFRFASGDLSERLFAALAAGDAAGGDRRGRQSAALRVVKAGGGYGGGSDNFVDFRVDNDPDPIVKLRDMLVLRDLYYGSSRQSEKVPINAEFIELITPILIKKRLLSVPTTDRPVFIAALETFIGYENFEDRYDRHNATLDKPVFEYILKNY